METSGIVVIINIIVLLIAFFIKSVHDYVHRNQTNNSVHEKLDILNDIMQQIVNPNNNLLANNANNETLKNVTNVINKANELEQNLLQK